MSRPRTEDLPDVAVLLTAPNDLMFAVEQGLLRNRLHVGTSLAEQVAAKLAGVITLDLVHPGQRLLEQDISKALGVSRAPVREALRILERDRLVEFEARRGATVTAPSPDDLRDVFSARSALYEILLRNMMQDDAEELESVLAEHVPEMKRTAMESPDAYAVSSFLLNAAICGVYRHRLLADLIQSVSLQTLRYVRLGLAADPDAIGPLLATWDDLYEAVSTRDLERVSDIARSRIGLVADTALSAVVASGDVMDASRKQPTHAGSAR